MEYNFVGPLFFFGLFVGGIPWATFFADGNHLKLQRICLFVQGIGLLACIINLLFGLIIFK